MSDDMKPCPFCDKTPEYQKWHTSKNAVLIICANHDCPGDVSVLGTTKKDAFQKWNTRTPSPSAEKLVTVLKDLRQQTSDFFDHTVDRGWVDYDCDSDGIALLKDAIKNATEALAAHSAECEKGEK